MNINELRNEMVKAVRGKYPVDISPENRYINLTQQVTDFGKALQAYQGNTEKNKNHDTVQHLIACIMVDLFMFSDYVNADLEKEVLAAIKWFKTEKK